MSMRNEMIRRWKERRAASGTTSLAETSATVTRPATGDESWKEEINHALPKIIEAAVVAAFSSDNFREAVASMVEPAFGRQHDKLNQLRLANLNLESTIQTRLDELPALLQPAIDHMTSIQPPSNEKEFDRLKAGQDGCLHLLELFGEKMGGLEQQIQNFDGRMKALEEKVVNADLRSAIRFGEISNEFQDRNATLNDRLWELEREVGGKVDSQQRKIVGLGEDLGNAIRKTQEKISALESVCSAPKDEGSASNDELLEKIEKMGKSFSKIDAMESSLRRDIHIVSAKVSSLDTSSLDSYPRRLEAIERSLSNLKDEIGTQGTLASLDSKLLSANNARLDTVASNVTKLGFLLESVKEEVSDDKVAQAHTERLESLDGKIAGLVSDVGTVQTHVGSLDTSALTTHSARLAELATAIALIGDHLKKVDTTPLSSHSNVLSDIKANLAEMRETIDGKLSSQAESFGVIEGHLRLIDTTALSSHSDALSEIKENLAEMRETVDGKLSSQAESFDNIEGRLKLIDTTPLSSHSNALSDLKATIGELGETMDGKLSSQAESFRIIDGKVSCLPETAKIDSILANLDAARTATSGGLETLSSTVGEILKIAGSTQDDLASQSKNLANTSQALEAFQAQTPDTLRSLSAKLDTILSQVDLGTDTLGTRLAHLSEEFDTLKSMANSQGPEISTALAKIISAVESSDSTQAAATKSLSGTLDETLGEIQRSIQTMHGSIEMAQSSVQEMHSSTMSEMRHKGASILAEVQKSNASHAEHAARLDEAKVFANEHANALEDGFANLRTVSKESTVHLDLISAALEKVNRTNEEHGTALKEALEDGFANMRTASKDSNSHIDLISAALEKAAHTSEEHATSLKDALEDGFANLRTVSKESNGHLDLISAALDTVGHTNEEHGTALKKALDHHRSHAASLATIIGHATQLVNGHEKLIPLAETHSSAIASLQDSVPQREDVATLRTHLEGISQTLGNHSIALEKANHTNSEHGTALKEALDHHQSHATSLATITGHATQLLNGHEKLILLAETHSSAITSFQDSVPWREEVATLRTHLEDISQTLGNQSMALENVSTHEAITSLSKQISESRDIGLSNGHTVQGELKTVRSLLEANVSLEKDIMDVNSKVRESVTEVFEELRSNKALMEEHSSHARTEGIAILDGILGLKTLAEDSKVLSELEQVKALIQDAKKDAKNVDAALQPQLKSIISNEEKSSASLTTILNLLESLEKDSATKSILDSLASLRALINDIDVNLASVTPEILVGTKAIEHALLAHSRTITEMNQHVQAVKDDPTTSSILNEIGMLKETAGGNAASLVAVNENLSSIGGKIKDSEDAISKTILDVQTAVSEQGVVSKADGDALSADINRLETHLAASTNDLQNDVKVIDALVRANGEAIGTSQSKLLDVHTGISRLGVDVTSIQTEHLPKLSQDVQAINLSKLNTASATTEKSLNTISTAIDELAQLSKGLDTNLSSLDGKVAQANGLTATFLTDLQTSLQSVDTTLTKSSLSTTKTHGLLESHTTILDAINSSLDATLTQSTQSATTTHSLLQSHTPLLESLKSSLETTLATSTQSASKTHTLLEAHSPVLQTIKSSLDSNNTLTSTTLSTLSTNLETISTELSTIAPAVRINSAAISRVDRAVLETGAQIKSVVLEGSSKTSREIDAALEQIDESLHDSNTRLMGISDFELPRIREAVKELESLVERELDGGLRETRRNGTRLGVIGAKVLGTKKLFDELVEAYASREEGGNGSRSLEGSMVLGGSGYVSGTGSIGHGRGEFRRLGSSRFRSHSNASSGKEGSASGGKGNHT
jgi:predicted  nucleic acid-binding Zn-ribbon protein